MRVFHFLEKRRAVESLIYERLKISLFNDMNDPFELLGVNLRKKSDRQAFYQLKKEVSEEMGAICFSKSWSSPVLWSHYGERHRGVVLGFDIPTDHAHKISYTGNRLQQEMEESLEDQEEDLGYKLLTTKFEHWVYEDEVRMLIKLEDAHKENGIYFLPYCNALQLKEIIIGPRCDLTSEHILKLAPSSQKGVQITTSRLAFKSYAVVPNKKYKAVQTNA